MLCQPSDVELEVIVNRIKNGDINLQPDFQRGEVWSDVKKRKLVDTILRGWKIPPIHMISNEKVVDEVLDGQQRLATIRDFFNDEIIIDGSIQPKSEKIEQLGGYTYSTLPIETQRELRRYVVTIIRLTEYKTEEPAELFYRLNQPATLTAAEQRNAYIGNTRNQIKDLVYKFEEMGADKDIVGFSNSRLAYDEIISKYAYMIEVNSLKKKVTAGDISKQYREDNPFSSNTIAKVENTLCKYVKIMKGIKDKYIYHPKLSKATLVSWLIFLSSDDYDIEKNRYLIYRFESTRDYLKNKLQSNIKENCEVEVKELSEKYTFLDTILNVYNQRASMGSTDALSIIYRDIIINIFADMIFNPNGKVIINTIQEYEKLQNMNAVLESINCMYNWGEKIR